MKLNIMFSNFRDMTIISSFVGDVSSIHKREYNRTKISAKEVADKVRDGWELDAITPEGEPYNKQVLIFVCFRDAFLYYSNAGIGISLKKLRNMLDHLALVMDEDKLVDIIQAGGMDEYATRVKKGFYMEGSGHPHQVATTSAHCF